MITVEDIQKAAAILREADSRPPGPFKFFTSGTGIPDEVAIKFFKNTNAIVITRDGTPYQCGRKMEDSDV